MPVGCADGFVSVVDTPPCDAFQIEVVAGSEDGSESHALPNHDNEHTKITTYRARMQKLWRVIGIWGVVDGCLGVILAVSALVAGQEAIAGDDPCESPDWIISVCILASHLTKGSTAAKLLLRGGESSHRGFLKQLMVITIFCCFCAALTVVEFCLSSKHLQAGGNCEDLGNVLLVFGSLDTAQLLEEIIVWTVIFTTYFGMRKENPSLAIRRVSSVIINCAEEFCASSVKPTDHKSSQNLCETDKSEHLTIAKRTLSQPSLLEEVASWSTEAVETPTSTSLILLPPSDPAASTLAAACPERCWLPSESAPVCNKVDVRILLSHVYAQSVVSRSGRLALASETVNTDDPSNNKSQLPTCSSGSEAGMMNEGGEQNWCDDFRFSCSEVPASSALPAPQVSIDKQCCLPWNDPVESSRREARLLLLHLYAQTDDRDSVSEKSGGRRRRKRKKRPEG